MQMNWEKTKKTHHSNHQIPYDHKLCIFAIFETYVVVLGRHHDSLFYSQVSWSKHGNYMVWRPSRSWPWGVQYKFAWMDWWTSLNIAKYMISSIYNNHMFHLLISFDSTLAWTQRSIMTQPRTLVVGKCIWKLMLHTNMVRTSSRGFSHHWSGNIVSVMTVLDTTYLDVCWNNCSWWEHLLDIAVSSPKLVNDIAMAGNTRDPQVAESGGAKIRDSPLFCALVRESLTFGQAQAKSCWFYLVLSHIVPFIHICFFIYIYNMYFSKH